MREEHLEAFKHFAATLPADLVAEWTAAVQAWELDSTKPNPFESDEKSA